MRRAVAVFAAILVVVAVVPASGTAAATQEQDGAYAGTHVAFDARVDAVTDYTVGGATVFDSLRVESAGSGEADGSTEGGLGTDAGASLSASADVSGSAVSLSTSANAEAAATVTAESGATLSVHDTPNANLVVASDDGTQALRANVSDGATVAEEGDSRVVVENGNATGVFVAVGDASVAKSDDGDVVARVGEGGRIVLRAYGKDEERTESDREAEELIADGTATAELYLSGESASVVRYDGNTTVTVAERSAEGATFAVERSVEEGAVVLASVSGAATDASDSLEVTVDGEAAARVESASELRAAANGGERSAYAVADGSAEADASTDVHVALNHFSERTVTVRSAGDASAETTDSTAAGTTDDADTAATTAAKGETGTETASSVPGFGATAALLALAGAALVAVRRR